MAGLEPYDDLREERRRRLADSQARAQASQNNRAVTVARPSRPTRHDMFPNLPVAEPFNLDNLFPSADPNIAVNPDLNPSLDQPAEDKDLPFGTQALGNFFSAVSRGDTSGIDLGGPIDFLEKPLEAVAKPFAVVGQGALKVLETGSDIGHYGASNVTNMVQQLMPGQQELERLVSERRAQGMSYSDALEESWEEISLGSLSVPFFRTALTPEGSITIGFKDVIAAGFDPVELALIFGTGGFSAGLGLRGIATLSGKETLRQGLKTAVSQSVGVRGGRALGRGVVAGPRFIGKGDFGVTDSIERALTGFSTEAPRREPVRVVGRIPDLDKLSSQTFKPTGTENLLGKITKNVPGARRIIGVVSPARVARESAGGNLGEEARVMYETSAAHATNLIDASIAWVQEAGDPMRIFELSRENAVMAQNIKLTAAGEAAYRAKGLPLDGVRQFGDVAEFVVTGVGDMVSPHSLFQGLNATQIESLGRMHRFVKELIDMMIEEGVYDNVDEALRGKMFRDAAGKVIDSEQALGDPSQMFRYMHRKVTGKEIVDDVTGEVKLLEFTGGGPSTGAVGKATSDFTKSRAYEFLEEGVREGRMYANPIESLQDFASAAYRRVAEKRAVDVLERRGKLVTSKQALERLYKPVIDKRIEAQSMYGSILRNVNRLKGKAARRTAKSPLLKQAIKTPATREAEVARRIQRLVDREADMVLKYESHMEVAATSKNPGAAARAKKAADAVLGEYRERAKRIDELEILQQQHINDQVAGQRRVRIMDTEMFGITDDLAQAEAELVIAQLTLKGANKEYRDTLERIAGATDLDARVFGGVEGRDTVVRMYKDGPLAGKLAPANMGDALTGAFQDRGSNILSKVELVTGTARTLSAGSADVGWLSIQGGMLAFTHPTIWAQAAAQSIAAIKNPERLNKYVAENLEDIFEFIENGGDIGGSEFLQSISSTGGLTRVTQLLERKLPEGTAGGKYLDVWTKHVQPIGRLGTGFNTFLDVSKIELWKSLRTIKNGGHVVDGELARHVNNMMGTLNSRQLGVSPTRRQLEGALFLFSPRFTRSAFALIGEMLRGPGRPGTLDGLASRESMRAMSGMIAGSSILLTGLAEALDKEPPELNPFKPGWLTMDVGNQSIGVGGSTRALLDAMAKSTAAVAGLDRREASDILQWNLFNPEDRRANPMLSYWLNRTAPGVRELLTQETFDGEQLDTPVDMAVKGIAPKFLPFAMQEMLSPGPGVPRQSPIALIPESLGLRARPLSAYERLLAAQDKAARESDFGRVVTGWDEEGGKGLSADEKDFLERQQPELRRLAELARVITNPVLEPYFLRVDNDRQLVDNLIDTAAAEFMDKRSKGIMDGPSFRKDHDNAVRQAFNLRQRREAQDGEFADALETLEESREARLSSQTEFDRIYNEYLTEVLNNPVSGRDAYGNVNFREQAALEKAFRERIGEEYFGRIRNFHLGFDAEGVPLNIEDVAGGELTIQLRRDKEILREAGYWKIADDIIGNDPQALALWDAYESSGSPAQQEAYKRQYPGLAKIEGTISRARMMIRRDNAAVDAALGRWYGYRAVNKETRAAERVFANQARQDLQRQAIGSS